MTLKELKVYITSLPKEEDNQEVVFQHLNAGYPLEYEIKGYFKMNREDKSLIVLTDLEVMPKN